MLIMGTRFGRLGLFLNLLPLPLPQLLLVQVIHIFVFSHNRLNLSIKSIDLLATVLIAFFYHEGFDYGLGGCYYDAFLLGELVEDLLVAVDVGGLDVLDVGEVVDALDLGYWIYELAV